jgi:hypothetical protein
LSRVKTCGESEFDIFEANKHFPDSGKAYYVLKRKTARILPKNDLKMCGESEFDIDKIPWIQDKLYIDAKITYFGLKATLFLIFILLTIHEYKKKRCF